MKVIKVSDGQRPFPSVWAGEKFMLIPWGKTHKIPTALKLQEPHGFHTAQVRPKEGSAVMEPAAVSHCRKRPRSVLSSPLYRRSMASAVLPYCIDGPWPVLTLRATFGSNNYDFWANTYLILIVPSPYNNPKEQLLFSQFHKFGNKDRRKFKTRQC